MFGDLELCPPCPGCGNTLLLRWFGETEQQDGREVRLMRAPCVVCDTTRHARLLVPEQTEFDTEPGPGGTAVATAHVVRLATEPSPLFAFTPATEGGGPITWTRT